MHQLGLVAFVILMESRGGIVGKSPRDIAIAWQACGRCRTAEQLVGMLDHKDELKLRRWLARWGKRFQQV